MSTKVFYPPCQWLDPNTRDAKGHFYCEFRCRYVEPAPNCWHRDGKTRVPTL